MNPLKAAITDLARVRANIKEAERRKDALHRVIDAILEEEGITEDMDRLKAQLGDLRNFERDLRAEVDQIAFNEFSKTGEKGVSPVVTVCEKATYHYKDEEGIIDWLIGTGHKFALSFDKKAVQKILKAGITIPGAETGTSLYTRVATDLSDYLGGEND